MSGSSTEFDRVKGALASFVRNLVEPRLDFLALYPAKAVAQNADGTLEVVPEDQRIPSMAKVPIRTGVPGVAVKIAPGARVLVGFAGGNPKAPIAYVWEGATVTELKVSATAIILNDGATPVAKEGSACTFTLACPNTGGGIAAPVTGTISVGAGSGSPSVKVP
jgi:hypothetical protein